ncbi:MAG: hypothetical protein IPN93_07125 [Bacteroidetes bacterium]|nr:hypothetical protein [Bacteroidota bacterium]
MIRFYTLTFLFFILFSSKAVFAKENSIEGLRLKNTTLSNIFDLGDSLQQNAFYPIESFGRLSSDNISKEKLTKLIKIINPSSFKFIDSLRIQYDYCGRLAEIFLLDNSIKKDILVLFRENYSVENEILAFEKVLKFFQNTLFDLFITNGWDMKANITMTYCNSKNSRDIENLIHPFISEKDLEENLFFVIYNYSSNLYTPAIKN